MLPSFWDKSYELACLATAGTHWAQDQDEAEANISAASQQLPRREYLPLNSSETGVKKVSMDAWSV